MGDQVALHSNFLLTESKPQIFFLPANHNERTQALLEATKASAQKLAEDGGSLLRELDEEETSALSAASQMQLQSTQGQGEAEVAETATAEDGEVESVVAATKLSDAEEEVPASKGADSDSEEGEQR